MSSPTPKQTPKLIIGISNPLNPLNLSTEEQKRAVRASDHAFEKVLAQTDPNLTVVLYRSKHGTVDWTPLDVWNRLCTNGQNELYTSTPMDRTFLKQTTLAEAVAFKWLATDR